MQRSTELHPIGDSLGCSEGPLITYLGDLEHQSYMPSLFPPQRSHAGCSEGLCTTTWCVNVKPCSTRCCLPGSCLFSSRRLAACSACAEAGVDIFSLPQCSIHNMPHRACEASCRLKTQICIYESKSIHAKQLLFADLLVSR